MTATHGLYFIESAIGVSQPSNFWKSDGTAAGTSILSGAPTQMIMITVIQDNVVLLGRGQLDYYNPTVGFQHLSTHCSTSFSCIAPYNVLYVGNTMFFMTKDNNLVLTIWASNFTAATTRSFCSTANCVAATDLFPIGNLVPFFSPSLLFSTTSHFFPPFETVFFSSFPSSQLDGILDYE